MRIIRLTRFKKLLIKSRLSRMKKWGVRKI
jgi:hypothetical protein